MHVMCDTLYGETTKKKKKREEKTHNKKHVSGARAQNALIRSPGKIPASKLARVARA